MGIIVFKRIKHERRFGHHLASLDILGVEENVVAGNKVTRWAADLQNLVPNTGE